MTANCSVNLEDYSFTSKISHFDGNKIWITDTIKSNIEYENIVFNNNLISKIADYYHKVIILDAPVSDIKIGEIVILRPRCDKNFETCCNKYDNAVNFRGEPFI
ncbi:MAG UNVERIFIED_CONTAM: phage BR0599 family protein [Rickettsiaceae bacterium]